MVILGGVGVSYERGTPVPMGAALAASAPPTLLSHRPGTVSLQRWPCVEEECGDKWVHHSRQNGGENMCRECVSHTAAFKGIS